ncbi:hypothetical protein O181_033297 [Austropuccinia psidii MF-1]|uniref:Uncharacterized protein n=1 Tax=Austropuccinia psidii MF-1 TaxID=1389203 RepID=A0A9Q3D161_9BASI|nr:hypothetical protein [Austropuccinia psidii MF-1]
MVAIRSQLCVVNGSSFRIMSSKIGKNSKIYNYNSLHGSDKVPINIPSKESSDDEFHLKTKMIKLGPVELPDGELPYRQTIRQSPHATLRNTKAKHKIQTKE